jgi:hypothetical protein
LVRFSPLVLIGWGEHRQHLGLVLGQEPHHWLGVLGASDQKIVSLRLDPESSITSAAQEG